MDLPRDEHRTGDAVIRMVAASAATSGGHRLIQLANAAVSVVVVIALTSTSVARWVGADGDGGRAGAGRATHDAD